MPQSGVIAAKISFRLRYREDPPLLCPGSTLEKYPGRNRRKWCFNMYGRV